MYETLQAPPVSEQLLGVNVPVPEVLDHVTVPEGVFPVTVAVQVVEAPDKKEEGEQLTLVVEVVFVPE